MIPVTESFLRPIGEYEKDITDIWHRGRLANRRKLTSQIEIEIKNYLKVNLLSLITLSKNIAAIKINMDTRLIIQNHKIRSQDVS